MPLGITDVFADLPDPRSAVNRRHHLTDILTIALCAVISGADGWEQIAEYGWWPEEKATEDHADGIFMERIGFVTPILPIDVKVSQNRRTPRSTYAPSR